MKNSALSFAIGLTKKNADGSSTKIEKIPAKGETKMKLKLQFLIAAVIGLAVYIPAVQAQANHLSLFRCRICRICHCSLTVNDKF